MTNSIFFVLQIVSAGEINEVRVINLISTAGPVVKSVLLLLFFMSLISWVIIFSKLFIIRRAVKESEKFLDFYQNSNNLGNLYSSTRHIGGSIAELFRAGYTELLRIRRSRTNEPGNNPESKANPETVAAEFGVLELVERAMKKTMSSEVSRLDSSLIFLATTGSTAPFIGLFGTVWGIMTSFIGLASREGVPTLQAVAPGIAEALIATAVGLAAAIPAVVAYNYFVNRVRRISIEMDNFSAEFLNIVERHLAKI
ncbi:MAG TPA: protein TolQ [Thermodesulfobacteriota bacterium]